MKGLLGGLLFAIGVMQVAVAEPRGGPYDPPDWFVPRAAAESQNARTAGQPSRDMGDVRPGVAVPQISVPTRSTGGATNQMRSQPTGGGIDDGIARCRAQSKNSLERESCEAWVRDAGG